MRASLKTFWKRQAAEQRQWIADHGGNLFGYVTRYGSPSQPDFSRWPDGYYGMGGEAIYAADVATLVAYEEERWPNA